jgi:hypothetical protein
MKTTHAFALAFSMLLSACASDFIKPVAGAEQVQLVNANQVSTCASLGKVSVNVMAKVGIYTRDMKAVDDNLLQLGRNEAANLGGNTLVKDHMPEYGKQVFAVYQCRR